MIFLLFQSSVFVGVFVVLIEKRFEVFLLLFHNGVDQQTHQGKEDDVDETPRDRHQDDGRRRLRPLANADEQATDEEKIELDEGQRYFCNE